MGESWTNGAVSAQARVSCWGATADGAAVAGGTANELAPAADGGCEPVPAPTADERFMREALAEAHAAAAEGEVPIGAVVVHDGRIIARAHNRRELDADPSAHAEFSAVLAAARTLGRWRLTGCTVYVTLEPCTMCAGLMVNARVSRCVYGAADPKGGALGTLYQLNADSRLNHAFPVTAGVLEEECAEVLRSFFAELRMRQTDAPRERADSAAGRAALSEDALVGAPQLPAPAPRVLLAIDSFKGSATSTEAESWVEEGVRHACSHARVTKLPLADGGEGTLDAVAAVLGGERVMCEVTGPLGQPVQAEYLLADRSGGRLAVIEMAEAAGIGLSPRTHEAALRASTRGVGELVRDAVERGARTLYLALGGSATNDGGAGLLQALGAHVLDAEGREVGPGLAGLQQVESVDLAPAREVLNGCELVILSDVKSPLVGRRGALAVYGLQKGLLAPDAAEPDAARQAEVGSAAGAHWDVPSAGVPQTDSVRSEQQDSSAAAKRHTLEEYDRWMVAYGRALDAARSAVGAGCDPLPAGRAASPSIPAAPATAPDASGRPAAPAPKIPAPRSFRSVLGVPGAGAAGGLAAALLVLGGRLVSGADAVLDLIGFDEALSQADLLITGEGTMDAQTAQGKAPVCAARRARRHHVPTVAVVGGRADDLDAVYREGIGLVLPTVRRPMPLERALAADETRANLRAAGETAVRAYLLRSMG